jgi:hypothetical protein
MCRRDWVTSALVLLGLGGSAGCGGTAATPANEDTVRCLAPATNAMTDFANGLSFSDQVGLRSIAYAYPSTALTVDTPSGTMHVAGSVSTYSGVGIAFDACVNASSFSGVEFSLGVSGTSNVTLHMVTRENQPEPPTTTIGTCVPPDPNAPFASCYPAFTRLTVMETPAPFSIPFASLSGGSPHVSVNPGELLSMYFDLGWSSGDAPFGVDLTLSDLRFTPK